MGAEVGDQGPQAPAPPRGPQALTGRFWPRGLLPDTVQSGGQPCPDSVLPPGLGGPWPRPLTSSCCLQKAPLTSKSAMFLPSKPLSESPSTLCMNGLLSRGTPSPVGRRSGQFPGEWTPGSQSHGASAVPKKGLPVEHGPHSHAAQGSAEATRSQSSDHRHARRPWTSLCPDPEPAKPTRVLVPSPRHWGQKWDTPWPQHEPHMAAT